MVNRTTYKLSDEIALDYRRAAWLAAPRVLVVSDLHLGYAWAHRHQGQLLPLQVPDDTLARLLALQNDYAPEEIVLLGDVVHRSVPVPALADDLTHLIRELSHRSRVTLITGNHDRRIGRLLAGKDVKVRLTSHHVAKACLLVHGDDPSPVPAPAACGGQWERIFIGHEHPAISLGDGVATWAKCPCFLVSEQVVVLPAFSQWAAGTPWGSHPFMSRYAQEARFTHAIAIAGDKMLCVPLGK